MKYIAGDVVTHEGFTKGYIGLQDGHIVERGKGASPKKADYHGYILPSLINAHTHIGDSFIHQKKRSLPKDIEQLVAPPFGIKHQLLEQASEQEILRGMKKSLEIMQKTGTSLFIDFREGGLTGLKQLKKAIHTTSINSIILARPSKLEYHKEEIDALLENSQGIGLSSITDWPYADIEKIAKHTKQKKKLFSIHASENKQEDIDTILNLKPDLLIHALKATESDLLHIKQENIPLVLCPRSNAFFGLQPPYALLKKVKVQVLLGTDNGMLSSPNIIDELKFMRAQTSLFSLHELFKMITYSPRKALNWVDCIQGLNLTSPVVVLDKKSLKPVYISK